MPERRSCQAQGSLSLLANGRRLCLSSPDTFARNSPCVLLACRNRCPPMFFAASACCSLSGTGSRPRRSWLTNAETIFR